MERLQDFILVKSSSQMLLALASSTLNEQQKAFTIWLFICASWLLSHCFLRKQEQEEEEKHELQEQCE